MRSPPESHVLRIPSPADNSRHGDLGTVVNYDGDCALGLNYLDMRAILRAMF